MSREQNPRNRNSAPHANHSQNSPQQPRQEISPIPWRANLDHDLNAEMDAFTYHLNKIESEGKADATVDSHRRRLERFVEWLCPRPALTEEDNEDAPGPDIIHTGEITQRHVQNYQIKRSREVAKTTVKTEMDTLNVFFKKLENYNALPQGFHHCIDKPELDKEDERRENYIDVDRGREITEYLRKYEWGSERHILWELIWTTAMRLGGVHSIDEDDIDWESAQIRLRHRPDQGTSLKNGSDSQRKVNVPAEVMDALADWLDHPDRPADPEDEHGRRPLFPNDDGTDRRGKQYLRDLMYSATRPCHHGRECPHDRDPQECDAAQSKNASYGCPSSKATHACRSSAITRMRMNEVPKSIVSDEVDASEDVIEKHYDEMTEDQKADQRRQHLRHDDNYE